MPRYASHDKTPPKQATPLQVVPALEVPPPVPGHPGIELGDLHRATRVHDEVGDARGSPVVEVVERKGVAHLVQVDVDVLRVDVGHEVLLGDALAPVAAGAAAEAGGEPEGVVWFGLACEIQKKTGGRGREGESWCCWVGGTYHSA